MKDYSKKIEELTFLKHYLLLENEIEAKYAPDEVRHYPKNTHNIEMLNRELTFQFQKVKESYLPILKRYKRRYGLQATTFFSIFLLNTIEELLNRNLTELGFAAVCLGVPSLLNLYQFLKLKEEVNEIEDMAYIENSLKEVIIEDIPNTLSLNAKTVLQEDKKITLNNIQSFKHKDIEKIKQYVEENIKK